MLITVIIPYYQEKPGLLGAAVKSVLAQKVEASIHIIVVDDESPLPAEHDLSACDGAINVTVIKQVNGGPGVARNKGLDTASTSTNFIAFLDSDDVWEEGHLKRAILALEENSANLFFEGVKRGDESASHFEGREREVGKYSCPLDHARSLFISNDDWYGLCFNGYIWTSSVVCRYEVIKSLRFPVEFYRFGEDQCFWFEVGLLGKPFVFSTTLGVLYGSGVDIFSTNEWGEKKAVYALNHEIRFRLQMMNDARLPQSWKNEMRCRLDRSRKSMALNLLYHLKRGDFEICIRQIRDDPYLAGRVIFALFIQLFKGGGSQR